jgi:MFS family permease
VNENQGQLGPVRQVRVRRAPKYQAFIGVGAALGLLIALVSGFTGPVNVDFSRAKLVGYLAIGFGLVGAALGGLVAILIERRAGRR